MKESLRDTKERRSPFSKKVSFKSVNGISEGEKRKEWGGGLVKE